MVNFLKFSLVIGMGLTPLWMYRVSKTTWSAKTKKIIILLCLISYSVYSAYLVSISNADQYSLYAVRIAVIIYWLWVLYWFFFTIPRRKHQFFKKWNLEANEQKIMDEYVRLAGLWDEAVRSGNPRSANKYNKSLTNLTNEVKENELVFKKVLSKLLEHSEPSVRLFAAADSLKTETNLPAAEKVLNEISTIVGNEVINKMAKILLEERKGKS